MGSIHQSVRRSGAQYALQDCFSGLRGQELCTGTAQLATTATCPPAKRTELYCQWCRASQEASPGCRFPRMASIQECRACFHCSICWTHPCELCPICSQLCWPSTRTYPRKLCPGCPELCWPSTWTYSSKLCPICSGFCWSNPWTYPCELCPIRFGFCCPSPSEPRPGPSQLPAGGSKLRRREIRKPRKENDSC